MNKRILQHNTVKSIPPPFACQIHSSKISDLGPLISFWPSHLPWELQRWGQLAAASVSPSLLQGSPRWHTRARSRNVLCLLLPVLTKEEVLEKMGHTVGLWPRQQSSDRRTKTYLCSSNLLWILFGKRESQAVIMSGLKIILPKEQPWSVMLWVKDIPQIHHQGLNRYKSLKTISSILHDVKKNSSTKESLESNYTELLAVF